MIFLGLNLDPTISIGNLVTWFLIVIGVLSAWFKMSGKVENCNDDIATIREWIKSHEMDVVKRVELGQALNTAVAVLTQAMDSMRDRLIEVCDRLERVEDRAWDGKERRERKGKKEGGD